MSARGSCVERTLDGSSMVSTRISLASGSDAHAPPVRMADPFQVRGIMGLCATINCSFLKFPRFQRNCNLKPGNRIECFLLIIAKQSKVSEYVIKSLWEYLFTVCIHALSNYIE